MRRELGRRLAALQAGADERDAAEHAANRPNIRIYEFDPTVDGPTLKPGSSLGVIRVPDESFIPPPAFKRQITIIGEPAAPDGPPFEEPPPGPADASTP